MIIQGGTVINYNSSRQADVRVEDGRITVLDDKIIPLPDEEVVDAGGCLVLPGGVDVHTHFDMPAAECRTSDDFRSGTRAAAAGGTTTIIDFAEPDLGAALKQGLDTWHQKADGKSYCDYSFHMTVSQWKLGTAAQMKQIVREGITSFKSYTAYKDSIGVEDEELAEIMKQCRDLGAILCVHCEDGDMLERLTLKLKLADPADIKNHPASRPNVVEALAIEKVVEMAERLNAAVYIVHVSTKEGRDIIARAKRRGVKVFGETCPHYLLLGEEKYRLPGFESAQYVMSPPLRSAADQKALWQGMADGVFDTVSTDHCSFNYNGQKELGRSDFTRIPNGIPSVEQRIVLLHHFGQEHGLTPEKIVELTAYQPARIFGLYPAKGAIEVGSDADLVIMKNVPPYKITVQDQKQQADYTPYEGFQIEKKIMRVYLRGEVVFDGNDVCQHPYGRFINRNANEGRRVRCQQS